MTQKINVALLGYGLSGRVFHYPFLNHNKNFEVRAILSSKKELADEFSNIKITQDLESILKDSNIDLIINALPNTMHFSVTKSALEQGKHVVVEKPFVNSKEQGEELIALAQNKKCILTVFHNRRLDNDYCLMKDLINKNELGQIQSFESRFDRFSPIVKSGWRDQKIAGSGVYYDLAPHLLDQALDLFGLPKSYQVNIETQRQDAEVDDFFEIKLNYDGFQALLTAGCLVKDPTPRLKLKGAKKTFLSAALDPQEKLLKEKISIGSEKWDQATSESFSELIDHYNDSVKIKRPFVGYGVFYENLANAINNGTELLVKPGEALEVMKLLFKGAENPGELITLK